MPSRMVKIDDVPPGAKLVKDVLDSRGMLLFKAGVELSAPMIERIRARAVVHLFIEDVGGPGLSEADLAAKGQQADAELDSMFSDVISKPLMAELKEAARQYQKRKLGG